MKTIIKLIFLSHFIFFFSHPLIASPLDADIDKIESTWAETYYSDKTNAEKRKIYEGLITQAKALSAKYPEATEALVWQGILVSNIAGVSDSLEAYKKVNEAIKILEDSIKKDPKVLSGSAYINLGIIYHVLPWPLGDDDVAEQMFKKAMAIDPQSMDVNFNFGKFMEDKDNKSEAIRFYKIALNIAPRINQKFADDKLKEETKAHLKKLGVNVDEYVQIIKERVPANGNTRPPLEGQSSTR